MRRNHRPDNARDAIVAGLRKAGVRVELIGKPVDILCRFWSDKHQDFIWMPMEIKSLYGKRVPKARMRSDQETQRRFLAETGVPVVTSLDEALRVLRDIGAQLLVA